MMTAKKDQSFFEKHKEKLKFILMYPTLAITVGSGIFAGIPTIVGWVQATMYGVPIGKWAAAQEQWELSKKNDKCLQKRKKIVHLRTEVGHRVTILLCPTGDFRVKIQPIDRRKKPSYRWVGIDKFTPGSSSLSCSGPVQAEGTPKPDEPKETYTILCEIPYEHFTRQIRKHAPEVCDAIDVSRYTGEVINGPVTIDCSVCPKKEMK